MDALSRWIFGFFLSTWGIAVLAALDSSVLFSLPFALDAGVVFLVAQHRDLFWLYPLLVMPASLVGAASTYWLGWKIGEDGLQHFIPKSRLDRVHNRVHNSGAYTLAALDLLPPPVPFTPVILVSGALEVSPRKFFLTLAGVRIIRFGGEAVLALFYGETLVNWLKSDTVRTIAVIVFLLVLVGAAVSSYRLIRSTSKGRRMRSAA